MGVEAEQLIDQLRATLENVEVALSTIDEAVVWVGRNHRVQWCNRAFEKLVDCTYVKMLGQSLLDLLPLYSCEQLLALEEHPLELTFSGGDRGDRYQSYHHGCVRTLDIKGKRIDQQGMPAFAVLLIRDVTTEGITAPKPVPPRQEACLPQPPSPVGATVHGLLLAAGSANGPRYWDIPDHQRSEADLRRSAATFRRIVEQANDVSFLINPAKQFIYVSPNLSKLTGYEPVEVQGKSFEPFVFPGDLPACNRAFEAVLASGQEQLELEFRSRHKAGHWIWHSANLTLSTDGGEPVVVGVTRDIGDRKQREEALKLIVEGTASDTGDAFFQSCVAYVANLLQADIALISEFANPELTRVRTLAVCQEGRVQPNIEFDLENTPCQTVLQGTPVYCREGLQDRLPKAIASTAGRVESYLGIPLVGSTGEVLGHIAVVNQKPMQPDPNRELFLKIFAARAGAELERQHIEAALRQREQKYRALFENSQVGIGRTRLSDGLVLEANRRFAEIMGYATPAEMIGQVYTPKLYVNPCDRRWILEKLYQQGGLDDVELQLWRRTADGGHTPIWAMISLRLNAAEACLEFVITDITGRKQAEAALRLIVEGTASATGEEFFRTCVRYLAEALQVRYAFITEIDPAANTGRTLAYWANGAITNNFAYFIPDTPCSQLAPGKLISYPTGVKAHFPHSTILQQMSAEGYLGTPLVDSSGHMLGHLAVLDDKPLENTSGRAMILRIFAARATGELERLKTETALRQSKEAAEAANHAKSQFLANMSHELRTPMNAILGFTQLIVRDPNLSPQHQSALNIINTSGEHLLTLINDVLEMSKIEAGRVVINNTCFDLHELLQRIKALFRIRAGEKQLILSVELAPDAPRYIVSDQGKLRQVLINLVGNAIKFTQSGHVSLRVGPASPHPHLSESASTYCLYFAVEDTGPGIPAPILQNLFKPFVQASSHIPGEGGAGLGLAITHQFVRMMGGQVTVESEVGQGSTFSFFLPVTPTELSSQPPSPVGRTVRRLATNQTAYRLLVVDDRCENREPLEQLLASVGFEVEAVSNGLEAIERFQHWRPHLIWMDMHMPVMDGYAATRRIREMETTVLSSSFNHSSPATYDPTLREIATASMPTTHYPPPITHHSSLTTFTTKIIALTASAFEDQRQEVLAVGCDDIIHKPFQAEEIFTKLADHLGVVYCYVEDETPPVGGVSSKSTGSIDLSCMPLSWREELAQAAIQADADWLTQLIAQIPKSHAERQESLMQLVERFDFDALVELTENQTHAKSH